MRNKNDLIAATVSTSTCTPGLCDLSQAYGENLGESVSNTFWKSPWEPPLKHPAGSRYLLDSHTHVKSHMGWPGGPPASWDPSRYLALHRDINKGGILAQNYT